MDRRRVLAGLALLLAAAPPALARSVPKEWYFAVGTGVLGPFDLPEMIQRIKGEQIAADTMVYVAYAGWRQAREHFELSSYFPAQPAAALPPTPSGPAGPPGETERDLKAAAFLTGTWRTADEPVKLERPYVVRTNLVFAPDGSLAGVWALFTAAGAQEKGHRLTGSYKVKVIDEQTIALSLAYRMVEEDRVLGSVTATHTLTVTGQKTLTDQRTGWSMTRVPDDKGGG